MYEIIGNTLLPKYVVMIRFFSCQQYKTWGALDSSDDLRHQCRYENNSTNRLRDAQGDSNSNKSEVLPLCT